MNRLRYIGNISKAKEAKNFTEDFIERLKFAGSATDEEIDKVASKIFNKR